MVQRHWKHTRFRIFQDLWKDLNHPSAIISIVLYPWAMGSGKIVYVRDKMYTSLIEGMVELEPTCVDIMLKLRNLCTQAIFAAYPRIG